MLKIGYSCISFLRMDGQEKNIHSLPNSIVFCIYISSCMNLGIVIIRNAMLTFQSQADISFVGWMKTPACWWGWSCTAIWEEHLEFCSRARKGALASWMWLSYNCVGTKLAMNQTLCLSDCPPGRVYVLHRLQGTGKGFKRQVEEKIECHLKHISRLLLKWKPSNFEWIHANNVSAFLYMIRSLSSWLQSHVNMEVCTV